MRRNTKFNTVDGAVSTRIQPMASPNSVDNVTNQVRCERRGLQPKLLVA